MDISKVYRTCDKYQFCTLATNDQLAKIFELVETDQCPLTIATSVWLCSEGYTLDKVFRILVTENIRYKKEPPEF